MAQPHKNSPDARYTATLDTTFTMLTTTVRLKKKLSSSQKHTWPYRTRVWSIQSHLLIDYVNYSRKNPLPHAVERLPHASSSYLTITLNSDPYAIPHTFKLSMKSTQTIHHQLADPSMTPNSFHIMKFDQKTHFHPASIVRYENRSISQFPLVSIFCVCMPPSSMIASHTTAIKI